MEYLIKELKLCIENKLYISAVNIALSVPDMCGAIDSENGRASGSKYRSWSDKYVIDKYYSMVTSDDFYKIRCASLHQGRVNHENASFDKILFTIPINGNSIHCNIMNSALNLDISVFVKDIIEGYNIWVAERGSIEHVVNNLNQSLQYRPNGLSPYIVGMPIFC